MYYLIRAAQAYYSRVAPFVKKLDIGQNRQFFVKLIHFLTFMENEVHYPYATLLPIYSDDLIRMHTLDKCLALLLLLE